MSSILDNAIYYDNDENLYSDSDYNYESDELENDDLDNNELENYAIDSCKLDSNNFNLNEEKAKFTDSMNIIPTNILITIDKSNVHYKWIIMCLKIYYNINNNEICIYNYETEPLNIYLINNNYKIKLYIESEIETFPEIPFKIDNIGDDFNLYYKLLILKNKLIQPSEWNICTNMFIMVSDILDIIKQLDYQIITDNEIINEIFIKISNNLNLNFEFLSGYKLPSFGIVHQSKNELKSTYSWKGQDLYNSMAEMLDNDIITLLDNINIIIKNKSYIKLTHLLLEKILEVKLTQLEYNINSQFYDNIVNLIKSTNYLYDINNIEKFKFVDEKITNMSDFTKVSFVEEFKSHKFNNIEYSFTPKLTKRIMSEIKNIEDAINNFDCYVIVSEKNICLFKLLFIPDSDTPYAYGFFEFDMYIPNDYPNKPPLVKFLTTGNGKVRFNPNLYNCGKVCLSIINTWGQNQWNPKSSTISQIILSISSMIFNQHPYTNEPGYYDCLNTESGKQQSEKYNENIKKNTLIYAINEQINNKNTLFKHIINKKYNDYKENINKFYNLS